MNKPRSYHYFAIVLVLLMLLGLSWNVLAGGKGNEERATTTTTTTTESSSQLSGQELWSMNCQRCHNMRSPVMYTDAQWQVIVHHMRIRANLTGQDARAITEFLKSGSR